MNLTDLITRMKELDSISESKLDECGCDGGSSSQQPQQDSVNMNISINGQGSGGIRDLMDILRNIESKDTPDVIGGQPEPIRIEPHMQEPSHSPEHGMMIIGASDDMDSSDDMGAFDTNNDEPVDEFDMAMDSDDSVEDESYGNSVQGASGAHKLPISSIIISGDDYASKGGEKPKTNGGGNPSNVDESLITHLQQLYNEIKRR